MKARLSHAAATGRRTGFTTIEMLVVMATLVLVCGAMVICNLFGASSAVRQQIWLGSSSDSAKTLGELMTDIRSGASNYVGTGNLNGFTNAAPNAWLQGNALKILQANTNGVTNGAWIMYYYDPATSNLFRTNWTGTNTGDFRQVSANMITTNNMYNSNIFSAYQFYNGSWAPQTNISSGTNVGTQMVLVCLGFAKLQNPEIIIGPGNMVDFYQIVTKIASRNRL